MLCPGSHLKAKEADAVKKNCPVGNTKTEYDN